MGRRFAISMMPLADRRRIDEWIVAGVRPASIHRRLKLMGVAVSYPAVCRYVLTRRTSPGLEGITEIDSVQFRLALEAAIAALKTHLLALERIDSLLEETLAANPRKGG